MVCEDCVPLWCVSPLWCVLVLLLSVVSSCNQLPASTPVVLPRCCPYRPFLSLRHHRSPAWETVNNLTLKLSQRPPTLFSETFKSDTLDFISQVLTPGRRRMLKYS